MAASYLRRDMTELATFSLFVRDLPASRGFLVCAGLESCLDFLEAFSFEERDLDHLRETLGFDHDTIEAFGKLRFTGDVWAVPEGRVVLAGEPVLEVTAPLPVAQLVETYLLNQVTLQTMLASKAARCRLAAGSRQVVDFSFRRAQGIEAAMAVARTSAMVGFAATSNVEAARRFGIPAAGTMAHSYVQAFASEEEAFRAFAHDFPARCTFLVDTYDTLRGVAAVIRVVHDLGLSGRLGIRLDSGDLDQLSRQARQMLDEAGLHEVQIVASGGLDEHAIARLLAGGAPVDVFGVGTRAGVSADAPFLDTVYKLVDYGGRPMVKLSPGKATLPGAKQVFRRAGQDDLLALRAEDGPKGAEPLLVPLMLDGRRTSPPPSLAACRQRFETDLAWLPEAALDLQHPTAPTARTSAHLEQLAARARSRVAETGA